MDLFLPDDLSADAPAFGPLADPAADAAVRAILGRYPGIDAENARLGERTAAHGISRNYLVETAAGRWVLKRRRGRAEQGRLEREVRLALALAERGVPVPATVAAGDGARVQAGGEDDAWVLYEYAQGVHFTGREPELESAGAAFARLVRAAADIPEPGSFDGGWLDDVAPLAREAVVDAAVAAIGPRRAELEGDRRLVHLDFHPANLLIDPAGRVSCVLDTEDLAVYPLLPALGFAWFKLARESVARGHATPEQGGELAARWLRGWRQGFSAAEYRLSDLGAGASYRVLALIRLILDRHVGQGDPSLLYDLPKQLRALAEIDHLTR
jgi:Ser/Thr protein kinase RdoA (MazF antagonist)